MLLKILKGRHVLLLILVPFVILGFWFPSLTNSTPLSDAQMPLFQLLQFITGGSTIALNIIGYLLLVLMAFMMVRLNEKFVFIRHRTDLPAFVFALLATGNIVLNGMNPALLASCILLFTIEQCFHIYHGNINLTRTFNTGFLVGLATLSYLYVGVYIVWIWISLGILGFFKGREILAALSGFLLPLFITFCWYFWNDNLVDLFQTITTIFNTHQKLEFSFNQVIYWGIIGGFILISSLFMFNAIEEKKISSRKYFIVQLVFFLCSAISFFVFKGSGIEQYYLVLVPVSYIISHYFVLQKSKWTGEILFWIFVIASILIHLVE